MGNRERPRGTHAGRSGVAVAEARIVPISRENARPKRIERYGRVDSANVLHTGKAANPANARMPKKEYVSPKQRSQVM